MTLPPLPPFIKRFRSGFGPVRSRLRTCSGCGRRGSGLTWLFEMLVPPRSAAIGRRNRWLNPVGVADFTGSGQPMIAAVITPHLEGSLRLYRLSGSSLQEVVRIDGFINHRLGERDLDLARIGDINGDGTADIVIPSSTRLELIAIGFKGGRAVLLGKVPVKQRIAKFLALQGLRAKIETDARERLNVIIKRD